MRRAAKGVTVSLAVVLLAVSFGNTAAGRMEEYENQERKQKTEQVSEDKPEEVAPAVSEEEPEEAVQPQKLSRGEETPEPETVCLLQERLRELGFRVSFSGNELQVFSGEEQSGESDQTEKGLSVSFSLDTGENFSAEDVKIRCIGSSAKEEEARLLGLVRKYLTADVEAADGIVSVTDYFFHPKTMYLTFDDGPSRENTGAILDILKARNIRATFFVIGENVRKYPEVVKRIAEEGHTIGIHCYCHQYNQLYESVDSYLADFEEACRAVKEVTGAEPRLFRFPGGSINAYNRQVYEAIIQEMTKRGYLYFDWNASLEDAVSKADPDTLIENAVSSTLGRRKVVMLAHDIVDETVLCLDELLDQFPEYQMKPLSGNVSPVQFQKK